MSILTIRNKLRLTRKQLAEYLAVSPSTIANYEYGIRSPRMHISHKLIKLGKEKGIKIRLEDIYTEKSN